MFSSWFIKVLERMYGRKLAAVIAETSGGSVTERTLRNWLTTRTTPDPQRIAELRCKGRTWLAGDISAKGWSPAECEAFVTGIDECPGILSRFVFSMHAPYGHYPESLELAREIDLLDQRLAKFRAADDLQSWVAELLRTDWILDEHLKNPDNDEGVETTRCKLHDAMSWEELTMPLAVIFVNTQFQLLATLDLEFCSRYLTDFEAAPVFASLLPRFDPRVELEGKTSIPTSRDLYHYPVRRLLDTIACMRASLHDRKWPQSAPTVAEMAIWLELAGQQDLAKNLVKWRMGRSFTIARFLSVWEACFDFLDEKELPPAPMPMMYAASVFTQMFINGSREERKLTFTSPDPAFYQHWWDVQRNKLRTEAALLRFGTKKWMPNSL